MYNDGIIEAISYLNPPPPPRNSIRVHIAKCLSTSFLSAMSFSSTLELKRSSAASHMMVCCSAERSGICHVFCSKGWEHLMTPAHIPTILNLSQPQRVKWGRGGEAVVSCQKWEKELLSSKCQTWRRKATLWWWLFHYKDLWTHHCFHIF